MYWSDQEAMKIFVNKILTPYYDRLKLQSKALCSHPRTNESDARKFEPSLNVMSRISGFICKIVANMIPRAVTTVRGAPVLCSLMRRSFNVLTTLGYAA